MGASNGAVSHDRSFFQDHAAFSVSSSIGSGLGSDSVLVFPFVVAAGSSATAGGAGAGGGGVGGFALGTDLSFTRFTI